MSHNLIEKLQDAQQEMNDDDFSDYEDVELPKMQRMNALIIIEEGNNYSPEIKKNSKTYSRKRCPICLEKKQQIRLLCGHTLCEVDLRKLIEIAEMNLTFIISCCICRTKQSVRQVITNAFEGQNFASKY